MMKKLLVTWMAVAIIVLCGVNLVNALNRDMTDKEIAEAYTFEKYGEDYYIEMLRCDDEYIRFEVLYNGDGLYLTSINRDYYTNRYNE